MYNPSLYGLDTAYPFYPNETALGSLIDIKDARIKLVLEEDDLSGYCPVGDIWLASIAVGTNGKVSTAVIKYFASAAAKKSNTESVLTVPIYDCTTIDASNTVVGSYIICSDEFKKMGSNTPVGKCVKTCNDYLAARQTKLYILPTCVEISIKPPAIKKLNGTTVVERADGAIYLKDSDTVKISSSYIDGETTIVLGGNVPSSTGENAHFYGVKSINGISGDLRISNTASVVTSVSENAEETAIYVIVSQLG